MYLALEHVAVIRCGFGALFNPEDWEERPLDMWLYSIPFCTMNEPIELSETCRLADV